MGRGVIAELEVGDKVPLKFYEISPRFSRSYILRDSLSARSESITEARIPTQPVFSSIRIQLFCAHKNDLEAYRT